MKNFLILVLAVAAYVATVHGADGDATTAAAAPAAASGGGGQVKAMTKCLKNFMPTGAVAANWDGKVFTDLAYEGVPCATASCSFTIKLTSGTAWEQADHKCGTANPADITKLQCTTADDDKQLDCLYGEGIVDANNGMVPAAERGKFIAAAAAYSAPTVGSSTGSGGGATADPGKTDPAKPSEGAGKTDPAEGSPAGSTQPTLFIIVFAALVSFLASWSSKMVTDGTTA